MVNDLDEFIVFLVDMFPLFMIISILFFFCVWLNLRDDKRVKDDFK